MKNFRYAIYQMINNPSFRQRLEEDMHQTLLEQGLSLSQMEQEALRDFLRRLSSMSRTKAAINASASVGPDIGWPLVTLHPQGTAS